MQSLAFISSSVKGNFTTLRILFHDRDSTRLARERETKESRYNSVDSHWRYRQVLRHSCQLLLFRGKVDTFWWGGKSIAIVPKSRPKLGYIDQPKSSYQFSILIAAIGWRSRESDFYLFKFSLNGRFSMGDRVADLRKCRQNPYKFHRTQSFCLLFLLCVSGYWETTPNKFGGFFGTAFGKELVFEAVWGTCLGNVFEGRVWGTFGHLFGETAQGVSLRDSCEYLPFWSRSGWEKKVVDRR